MYSSSHTYLVKDILDGGKIRFEDTGDKRRSEKRTKNFTHQNPNGF